MNEKTPTTDTPGTNLKHEIASKLLCTFASILASQVTSQAYTKFVINRNVTSDETPEDK